jgi:ABC-type amino acid transport substrate-binding protein
LTRSPISPRLAVATAALLALVLLPGSAQATARAAGRLAAGRAGTAERGRAVTRGRAASRAGSAAAASCNPADPLHPAGSLRPAGPPEVTAGSLMARIRARGYLIAGVDLTLYHLSYLNPLDGQIEGFTIDMLHAISAAIFGDDAILAGLAVQDSDTTMVGPTIVAKPQGLALSRRHPEFVRFVNAVLAQWGASGGWAASYARWIGTPVPAPPAVRYAD